MFDRKNMNTPKRDIKRTGNDERALQISQAFRKEFSPETKQAGKAFLYFSVCFAGLAVLIAGLLYWQRWQKKQMERELNDPMFLFKELNYVHQLSEQEKSLILELSDKNSLSSPLKLFVEPKFLLDALKNDSFTSSQHTVQLLLSKLFDITADLSGEIGSETVIFSRGSQA